METLYVSSEKIADISPLSGLTNLTKLYIASNLITDVSPLFGLVNLEKLYLFASSIGQEQYAELKSHIPYCMIIR